MIAVCNSYWQFTANPHEALGEMETITFPAQRQTAVLAFLRQHGAASIQDLASEIGASQATIRRDLARLSEQGYIERTHGGATFISHPRTTFEPDYSISSQSAKKEKRAIGRLAASRLEDGQSVIFDSSSTVLEVARAVVQREVNLTAVTNDLNIATVLSSSPNIQLIVTGGTLRPGSFTLLGRPGDDFISKLNVDVALIGIHAIVDCVLSETATNLATLKLQMIDSARHVKVLADSSKFHAPAFYNVCSVDRVNEIVTDFGATEAWRSQIGECDVEIAIANEDWF